MKYLISVLVLLASSYGISQEQRWMQLIESGASFTEIQTAFYLEWEGKEITRGSGYNVFKRWEYFMESRISAEGDIDISKAYLDAYNKENKSRERDNSYRSDGGNWESLGLFEWSTEPGNFSAYNPGNGRVNAIEKDPLIEGVYYVGTPSGGIWKTEDNFSTWEPLSDDLPTLGVTSICIDYTNSDIIYIGTGDGYGSHTYSNGVMKSIDGGETWQSTALSYSLEDQLKIRKLIIHPSNPNILFAATSEGLFKTTTAGETWYKVRVGSLYDVKFKPGDPETIYTCSSRFYKSIDGGEEFESVGDGTPSLFSVSRMIIGVSEDNPNYVYLLCGDSSTSGYYGMWRSEDSGDSFSLRSDSPNILGYQISGEDGENQSGGQAFYDLALDVDPANAEFLFTGGINVWRSINGGANYIINSYWFLTPELEYNYVHADIHYIKYIGDELFVCSDGGVFRSSDGGESFENVSEGLAISQFYRLGGYESDVDLLIGGTQDNGSNMYRDQDWFHVSGADGMEAAVDPSNPSILYSSRQNGGIRKSVNDGQNWTSASVMIDDDGRWVTPFVLHPTNSGTIYSGYTQIWKSTNYGAENVQISNLSTSSGMVDMSICRDEPNVLYAVDSQRLFKTSDDGVNWEPKPLNNYSVFLKYVDVNPENSDEAVVCYGGFLNGIKVFKTIDGGDTWENISQNLPNIPVNCVTIDPLSGDLYAGSDFGVYVLSEGYENWMPFSENLPNVIVNELEINHQNQIITAATFGRGIWRSDLFTGMESEPVADFEAEKFIICEGESIQFTDLSYGHFPAWQWSFESQSVIISNEQHPLIQFEEAGVYSVSLTVGNEHGDETRVEEFYIQVNSGSELFPYQEGFDVNSNILTDFDFQSVSLQGDVTWKVNQDIGRFDEGCVWIENGSLDEPFISELVSQTFDLSDLSTGYLSFWYAYAQKDLDDDDELRLYTSIDCGEDWGSQETFDGEDELASIPEPLVEEFYPELGNEQWIRYTYELDEDELTENFQFKFRFQNDNGNHIFIDDINITDTLVTVGEVERSIISQVYPNPASERLAIKIVNGSQRIQSLDLIDAEGRVCLHKTLPNASYDVLTTLSVKDLSAGFYYVRIWSSENKITDVQKVVIR